MKTHLCFKWVERWFRVTAKVVLCGGLAAASFSSIHGYPGERDTASFASPYGYTQFSVGSGSAFPEGVAVDAAGRIIVAGTATNSAGDTDMFAVRFLADGSLDTSFGTGGLLMVDIAGNQDDRAGAVTVKGNTILVAGSRDHPDGDTDSYIVQITPSGVVSSHLVEGNPGINESLNAITVDRAGKVYVTGSRGSNVSVRRFSATLVFEAGNATFPGRGTGVAVDSTGKIYVSYSDPAVGGTGGVARFTTAVVPDLGAWGGTGFVRLTPGSTVTTTGVVLDASERPVISGTQDFSGFRPFDHNPRIFLARVTTGGAVDTSFGVDGYSEIHFGGFSESSSGIAINPHGSILVCGQVSGEDFLSGLSGALVRFVPNGRLDTTFGSLGAVPSHAGAVVDDTFGWSYGVAVQSDGKVVVVGGSSGQVFLARYLGSSEWKYNEAQAVAMYHYFAGIGDSNQGLAYWFYFNAYRDRDWLAEMGYPAYAHYKYWEGLAYYYYTVLTGNPRLQYLYLHLGYAWYYYLLETGDTASAAFLFNYYYGLSQVYS